ncbi:hypothetical protein FGO68_gene16256 [Halteria grandinella]|uniref:Uncharacterized protein n=1 Tax=Halteria grandinella TaxID=5974 RepID=A0A8J8NIJ8_HALGN|nr:hypothetical protein FGO68_gene16256 [Halteria grandinella]
MKKHFRLLKKLKEKGNISQDLQQIESNNILISRQVNIKQTSQNISDAIATQTQAIKFKSPSDGINWEQSTVYNIYLRVQMLIYQNCSKNHLKRISQSRKNDDSIQIINIRTLCLLFNIYQEEISVFS